MDQKCAILTRPGDVVAVATALRRLIQDPALRQTLGQAGPDRAGSLCDPTRQIKAFAVLVRPPSDENLFDA